MRILRTHSMRIPSMAASTKKPRNLSLDDEAFSRGERYSKQHGTSISRLVGDFLRALPLDGPLGPTSPVVRRLLGVAAGKKGEGANHRAHILKKYGAR